MLITKRPALQVHWSFPVSPGPHKDFGLAILSKAFPFFHILVIPLKAFQISLQILPVVKLRILELRLPPIRLSYNLMFGVCTSSKSFYFTMGHMTLYYSWKVILPVIKVKAPTSEVWRSRFGKSISLRPLKCKCDTWLQASFRTSGPDVDNCS